MEIGAGEIIALSLGMIFQALIMIRRFPNKKDFENFAMIFFLLAVVLLSVVFSKESLEKGNLIMYMSIIGGLAFATLFRKRLILNVGAHLVVILNLLFIYLLHTKGFWWGDFTIFLVAIPTAFSFVGFVTSIGKKFDVQVVLFAWYIAVLIATSLLIFLDGDLYQNLNLNYQNNITNYSNIFLLGMFYLYVLSNAFYLVMLVPNKNYDNEEMKRHMQLLAYGYVWNKKVRMSRLVYVFGVLFLIFIQVRFEPIEPTSFVMVILFLVSLVDGVLNKFIFKEGRDGIGDLKKA